MSHHKDMPKGRTLKIKIECGETTCASEKGQFCAHCLSQRFGTEHFCNLFSPYDTGGGKFRSRAPLEVHGEGPRAGWLARLPECVEAEKAETEPVA